MSKCKGCGLELQNKDSQALGYTPDLNNKLCERCFKITNYNYHENRGKEMNNDMIIDSINKKKAFTFFLCDFLSLSSKIMDLFKKINNKKILVITKSDILPHNIKLSLVKERIKQSYNLDDVLFVSVKKNYDIDRMISIIRSENTSLFVGPSSSGKSTLINYLFDYELTTSSYQNTTQEFITLNYEDKKIIDAPGFIFDKMEDLNLKEVIKPRTLILKKDYELLINDIVIASDNDLTCSLYFPIMINIKTRKKQTELKHSIDIKEKSDMTILNIGFIYFKDNCHIMVNNPELLDVHRSIVGGK